MPGSQADNAHIWLMAILLPYRTPPAIDSQLAGCPYASDQRQRNDARERRPTRMGASTGWAFHSRQNAPAVSMPTLVSPRPEHSLKRSFDLIQDWVASRGVRV